MGLTNSSKKDLIIYRLAKSEEVFKEALDVASLNHWNLAVNRLYYSLFHACTALLFSVGNNTRTHAGMVNQMRLNYVLTGILSKEEGDLISMLFNMRQSGDYDDLFDWDREKVEPLFSPTRSLLQTIKGLVIIPD